MPIKNSRTAVAQAIAGAATLALLSGCGSSSSSDTALSFDQRLDEFEQLVATTDDLPTTQTADLLDQGTVQYNGTFFSGSDADISPSEDPLALLGDMVVDVTFDGSGSMTGSATNILSGDGTALTGSLAFSSEEIDRSEAEASFTGNITGVVSFPDGGEYSYTNFIVEGAFGGQSGEYLGAVGEGDFEFTDETIPFLMGFITEAQN